MIATGVYKLAIQLHNSQKATQTFVLYSSHSNSAIFRNRAMGTLEKTFLVLCLAAVFLSAIEGRLKIGICSLYKYALGCIYTGPEAAILHWYGHRLLRSSRPFPRKALKKIQHHYLAIGKRSRCTSSSLRASDPDSHSEQYDWLLTDGYGLIAKR